jgi:hypothetical protein
LGTFDIGTTPVETLMFQTGYLTIIAYDKESSLYTLGYPNAEVRSAAQRHILGLLIHTDVMFVEQIASLLRKAFEQKNIDEIVSLLKQLFVKVPYQLHTKDENFYHVVLQTLLDAIGLKPTSEYAISHGRLDMVLEVSSCIYIIEFKLNC